MIERLFGLVKTGTAALTRNSHPRGATEPGHPASTASMKRDTSSLVAATLKTGLLVGLALILILVILPAALAAQAAGPR